MKSIKFLTFTVFLSITSLSFGQGIYDALRFSQQYYEGTARSLSMGNAFTALGGDLGAISINPAASGVFRYSEFVFTPSLNTSVDHTTYLNNNSSENRTRFGISNLGWVGHFSTGRSSGLLNLNVAFTANQTNNFNSRTSAYGTNAESSWAGSMASNMPNIHGSALTMPEKDEYKPFYETNASWASILGWNTYLLDTLAGNPTGYIAATENIGKDGLYLGGPLDQKFYREITGYTTDVNINVGGNISNKFFFGANLTIQSINYHTFESFSETAVDPNNFELGFNNFTHSQTISTNGVGIGLKAGLIYLPVAGLRIGAAISTPTWMHLTDKWEEEMTTSSKEYGENYAVSPLGMYDYMVTSPFKWNIGAAYTFGKIGLISFDYENINYSQITMADVNGNKMEFSNENSAIGQTFKSVHNFRAGLEARLTSNISLRGGYNYYDSPEVRFDGAKHFASLGLGYKSNGGFFVDIAYQQQCNYIEEESWLYYDYPDSDITAPPMDNKYRNWKLLLSLGFRF